MAKLEVKITEKRMLAIHRASCGLVNFKALAIAVMNECKPIKLETFEVMLEAARVSKDYKDSLTLNNLVITLGVEK